jgi:radical SAM enzyme (TIGR01210 family)
MPPDAADQIELGSKKAGKTYAFDEQHDPTRLADLWFQESDEGAILFLVFYSQACRWSRCVSCNLPSRMSRVHVDFRALMAQVDSVFEHPQVRARQADIRKVILSNNGSMLDEVTFSSTALVYLLAKLNLHLPQVKVVSLESRPEFADTAELEFIARVLGEAESPTELEIAVGFEAFDDRIRNKVFDKGMTLDVFERLVSRIAPYNYHLKCYFMQKPVPEMSDEAAIHDIQQGIEYLGALAERYQIPINMHVNPTYVGAGTLLETAFRKGRYVPPRLVDVAAAVRHAQGRRISIFIGLHTEGLAIQGGSPIRPGEEAIVAQLEQFNRTQDYGILDRILESLNTIE